jgi:hypothetical protein
LYPSGPPPEDDAEVDDESELPAPPEEPVAVQEAPPPEEGEVSLDLLWESDYEELIPPEERPPKPRRRRRSRARGLAVLSVVLVFLLLWTLLSPHVLGPVGMKYVYSPRYADWGNYTGTRDTRFGTTTWGVSVTDFPDVQGNASMYIGVLVTKVSESTANWFLRGTGGIDLREVSAYDENETFLGAMTNHTDLGFGVLAYLPIMFPGPGSYWVYVKVSFLVNEVMRIGFFPLEVVNFPQVWLDFPIEVPAT